MQVSAEIRWFWQNIAPPGLEEWFLSAGRDWCAAGGGSSRTDEYLQDPKQTELGIKRRGEKKGVEVKGLVVRASSVLAAAPFEGTVEIWTKWTSEVLDVSQGETVIVGKQRWLRKFDVSEAGHAEIQLGASEAPVNGRALPDRGCNVELTQITLPSGETWWTLGFESFGAVDTVGSDVHTVAQALAKRRPPQLGGGSLASYPAWLQRVRA